MHCFDTKKVLLDLVFQCEDEAWFVDVMFTRADNT